MLDDRSESAGVKFNDADLIGIPLRLTVSKRTLAAEAVEFKARTDENAENIPRDQVVATIGKAHADGIAALTPDEPIPMPSLG